MILKSVIVEDEWAARKTLKAMLLEYAPEITVVAEPDSIDEGIGAIKNYHPDLVFLDLNLKGEDGLRILEGFGEKCKFGEVGKALCGSVISVREDTNRGGVYPYFTGV